MSPAPLANVFACLVHESRECVIDLVRNLRHLDPDSRILLYNGGEDADLLADGAGELCGALVHPRPRRMTWGRLHGFALDCMRLALDELDFDTLTVVDSDQLALRPGYSAFMAPAVAGRDDLGVLCSTPEVQHAATRYWPAKCALAEVELWRPFLRRFSGGEAKFPHWTFWPTTLFTAHACRELVRLFDTDRELERILERTKIFATEEVVLPTLVALAGLKVEASPCSPELVQFRRSHPVAEVERALDLEDAYWVHPVPRRLSDPLRALIREHFGGYSLAAASAEEGAERSLPLLSSLPVLEAMREVEGWLDDDEADLLLAAATRALGVGRQARTLVEVGSYCGRATTVLGKAVQTLSPASRVIAIDPHDGVVGAADQGLERLPPTLAKFRATLARQGLEPWVETVVGRAPSAAVPEAVHLLLIDGLHDYDSVAGDFLHFEKSVARGGLAVFHDYSTCFPGVTRFVDRLLAGGRYRRLGLAGSLMVVEKVAEGATDELRVADELRAAEEPRRRPRPARAPVADTEPRPLVSCILATYDRRSLVPKAIEYFERQDYPRRELIVVDDGSDAIADLLPDDPSIRYLRLDRRLSMGAKHNLACEAARGDLVCHWDDDDWMADWRISYQVEALRGRRGLALCGLANLYFFDPAAERAWEYVYPEGQKPWVAGGTFCYPKELWQRFRFRDMNEGTDTVFVWGLQGVEILPLADPAFFAASVHPRNTSPRRTGDSRYRELPFERVGELLGDHLDVYREWALGLAGGAPAPPAD